MLGIIGATDKGLMRATNEDRFAGEVFAPDFAYGVVCDGMGGENGGGVASGIACEEIRRMAENARRGLDERSVYLLLETAISTANIMVYDKAVQEPGDESLRGWAPPSAWPSSAGLRRLLQTSGTAGPISSGGET